MVKIKRYDLSPGDQCGGEYEFCEISKEQSEDGEWVLWEDVKGLLARGRPKVTREQIELEALKTERAGYEAENAQRMHLGQSLAYGAEAFQGIYERIRNIRACVEEKEAKNEREKD